jgi:surface protein
MRNKLSLGSVFTTALLTLTACGGNTNTSVVNNENTPHPEFSWAKVAVSNNYSPSGDITDLTPTFSWKASSGATVYNLGHEHTDGSDWKEYTVPAAEAGCATGPVCSYKPANHILNIGDQKVWWVRGKDNNQWQDWSSAHVFNVVDGSGGGGNTTTPITISPSDGGTVNTNTPKFTWQPVINAKSLEIGLEKQDGSAWKSFTVHSSKTSLTPSTAFINGDYTWWMRAKLNSGGWTNWSNGANFTINTTGTGSGGLKELQPTGTINTTTPKFTWVKENNASDYQIGFKTSTNWKEYTVTAISACGPATECFLKPSNTGLNFGDNVTWYIRAKVNGNWQEWTDGIDFSINQTPPNTTNRPFIIEVKTDNRGLSNETQFIIPTDGAGYNYSVDCDNDGSIEAVGITSNYTCNYPVAGKYTISISGVFPQIKFIRPRVTRGGAQYPKSDTLKLLNINQWGTQAWRSMESAFTGAENLTITATDKPNLNLVSNMSYMFYRNRKLNPLSLESWDISNVTNMNYLFNGAVSFNQDISNWNVGNVTDMNGMFTHTSFNQDISNWNVSNVTDMNGLFYGTPFNQNINSWNVSNVTDMTWLFRGSSFNQPLDNWDVSKVTKMVGTFENSKFNQNINNWDVSQVDSMVAMFEGASDFNKPINNWDVSNVTGMTKMFSRASSFNQPLDHLNVSNVTNMVGLFENASSFNQNINSWDVSKVTDMRSMFQSASSFNQPIGQWNIKNVIEMMFMFSNATSFDQDISPWDISNLPDMQTMLVNTSFSTTNYDKLLISWSQLDLKLPFYRHYFNAGNAKYSTAAVSARNKLINKYKWAIDDGGHR